MKKKITAASGRIFFVLVLVILLAGLVKTVFFPEDINAYENRYANKTAALTAASYADGSFQSSMEDALADQIHFSTTAKKLYNLFDFACARPLIAASGKTHYVWYNGYKFLGENILYNCYQLAPLERQLKDKADNINSAAAAHPELEFYLYYIEKDTDIDFLTGEKSGIYPYLRELVKLDDGHIRALEINGFDEFEEKFYRTDHHWNYRGSYEAYTEIAAMLGAEPLLPTEERTFSARLAGSKSFGSGRLLNEELTAYDFDFPEMDIAVNGVPASDYGTLSECFRSGVSGLTTYGAIYGGDSGLVEFDTHSGGENLLVLGESYDNAVVKLLASHFNKTYCVDLRYYSHDMGSDFDFAGFAAEHDIRKVLLAGNVDYYTMKEFMLVNY